jgi:hypothetical protein
MVRCTHKQPNTKLLEQFPKKNTCKDLVSNNNYGSRKLIELVKVVQKDLSDILS